MADKPKDNQPPAQRAALVPSDAKVEIASMVQARRAKADRLRARGELPFPNDVAPRLGSETRDVAAARAAVDHLAHPAGRYDEAAVRAAAGDTMLHLRGRIVALRSTGGLSFLRLRDATGEIQLLASRAVLGPGYEVLGDLDVGDFVEAEGPLTASKRGELSLEPRRLRLITKAYRPLPEKWHGLTDVELRYRQRYVDLVANPGVADVFRARSHIIRATRAILESNGFLEVETPTMHPLVGGAVARPFVTHHNALDMRLFMRIAPELYLKRLLVGGLERVYEIGRAYRNEGISTRHNPEFTILEFYQAYATCEDLVSFTETLLRAIDHRLQAAMPAAHALWKQARPFSLDEPFVRVTMDRAVTLAAQRTGIAEWAAAVERGGGPALLPVLVDGLAEHVVKWAKRSARAGAIDWGNFRKQIDRCDSGGERLFAAFEYVAEPFLTEDYRSAGGGGLSLPVFVMDYPFEVSPLARRSDRHPELTDRFELFVHGRELCNAFSELNDPDDQADRFRAQVERKGRGKDEETMDYDDDYVRALEHGMPPAAGFGMGMDRLVMALTNAASIRDVIFFPLLRPEAGQGRSGA